MSQKGDPLANEPKIPKTELEMLENSLTDFSKLRANLENQRTAKLNELKVIKHRIEYIAAETELIHKLIKRVKG